MSVELYGKRILRLETSAGAFVKSIDQEPSLKLPDVVVYDQRTFLILSPSTGLYREVLGRFLEQPSAPQVQPEFVTEYPATAGEALQFLVGWKWAIYAALENGWVDRSNAAVLDSHGERLAGEARERLKGEAR